MGCSEPPAHASPQGAVAAFVGALEDSRYDDARRADAYALLDAASQRELESLARRAESLGRSGLEPWDMLAVGRFRFFVRPEHYSAGSIEHDRATVSVSGGGRSAEVETVREGGEWRVVLYPPTPSTKKGKAAH